MITDGSHKQLIRQTKKRRDEWVAKLVEHPSNSEAAQQVIGANEVIRILWHYLDYSDQYSEEFSPYIS